LSTARTAAIVLAAGLGSRFGGRKLLAPLRGRPMLQHVLDLVAGSALDPVVVVLGADSADLTTACRWRDELRLVNARPADGISSSLRLALDALAETDVERAVVLLGDQPLLSADQLGAILEAPPSPILVPSYEGVPGNPVVLDRSVWPLARALAGDRGMSQLFEQRRDLVGYVELAGDNPGIDTPEELARINRA